MTRLGLLDDMHWLFAEGGMGKFLETKDHTYRDLTLKFLITLHVEVISGSCCQEEYMFFYLNGELYELNLRVFNSIFDFLPSLDLPYQHVPKEFKSNAFWNEIFGIIG